MCSPTPYEGQLRPSRWIRELARRPVLTGKPVGTSPPSAQSYYGLRELRTPNARNWHGYQEHELGMSIYMGYEVQLLCHSLVSQRAFAKNHPRLR